MTYIVKKQCEFLNHNHFLFYEYFVNSNPMVKDVKSTAYHLVNATISLLLGVVLYVLARPETMISQLIYRFFHLNKETLLYVPSFLTNYGCDLLWSYSLTHCIYLASKSYKYTSFVCIPFCILAEIIQLLPFVRLVFDPFDIIIEILGIVMGLGSIYLYHHMHTSHNHSKDQSVSNT